MNKAEQIWNDLINEIKQSFALWIIPSSSSGEYFKKLQLNNHYMTTPRMQ